VTVPESARPGFFRRHRLGSLVLVAATISFGGVAAMRQETPAAVPATYKFAPDLVTSMAKKLSTESPAPRLLETGSPLRQITYDQYRDIRVNAESGIWRNEQVPFRLELLPAGFLFEAPVTVSVVENGMARDLVAEPGTFILGPSIAKQLGATNLPLSGFRMRGHLNSRSVWDEFMVFQGASYFRAVAKGNIYGLSARGLALKTASPSGEEFPAFTHYWIERPSTNATGLVVHALLQSQSTTGAYRFSIAPGNETVMDVDLTLFPRVALDNVGLAPLTSMFLFDESNRSRIDDFRDEVHDSDGLSILMPSGEQIFRPLANPSQLQISSFTAVAPRAFGLVQRSRKVSDYHDLEAQYEKRPSAWIEPTSDWGEGSVQLIEIPSDRETNDNIVSLWRPKNPIPAGKPWHVSYRLRWLPLPRYTASVGRVSGTRTGPSSDGKRRLFVVDFDGIGTSIDGLSIDVGASKGKIINPLLQRFPALRSIRASFELTPGDADVAELRLRLLRDDRPVTETWLYRWTAS